MLCPNCQNEFPDWHFYCSHCHAQVQDYLSEQAPRPTMIERVGRVMLDLLVLLFFVGAGVLLWRAINWQELRAYLQPPTEAAAADPNSSKSRPQSKTQRPTATAAQRSQATATKPERTAPIASVRQMPQKIEELPAAEAAPKPTVSKPETTQPNSQLATELERAALGAEQIDSRQSGEMGLIAVNSYVPARIYVDGQFSGVTPRTVRLAAGSHQIRLIAEGHEDWTRRVQLKSRQQIGIMASLKKKVGQ